MLSTPHLLAGAAIGTLISNLPLVIILALISHYSFDLLPHLDQGSLNLSRRKTYFWAIIDILVAVVIFYLLFRIGKVGGDLIWWGAGVAIFPDFLDNLPLFSDWLHQYWPFSKIFAFHEYLQEPGKRYQFTWGIISQIVVVGISLWILLKY